MAYPVRLEVATLVGEPGAQEPSISVLPQARTTVQDLPPVADTTNTPTRRPVFVIGDSAKRPKTAGMLGSGRVVPMVSVDTLHPSTTSTSCLSPSSRPRSSPLIGRRRTRVTPLPPTTQLQAPTDTKNTIDHNHHKAPQLSLQGMNDASRTSKVPKWNRERRREFHKCTTKEENEAPWPNSSLDSGPLDHASSTPNKTTSPAAISIQGGHSPWVGRYTVPTINVASEHSSSRPLKSSASLNSNKSDFTSLEHSRYVTERIHHLVTAFSQRANRVKAQITQPPTPSTELSEGGDDANKAPDPRQRLDSLMDDVSSRSPSLPRLVGINTRHAWLLRLLYSCRKTLSFPQAMEPQSRLYISWLLVVCIVYVYNAWVIPLRSVFTEYQTDNNLGYWLAADYLADLVYVLDVAVFKSRVMYLDNGFWINVPSLMRRHYWKTPNFRYELASLLPLDLLYFKFGPISVFRLPRLIKIHTFWEFFHRLDSVLSSPHAIRVIRTVLYMLFLIHLNTCAYYGFSKIEGIGSNKWVFQGVGNAYIRCFYFATKTATSIGKNPKPEKEGEYLFMTCSWLMGVFVFALLIGQIRDIVATATHNQNEYRNVMDQTQAYLHRLNLPASLQERVRLWFTYTWQNQKTLNEMKCLESLPRKMRTDIAISVHIQILSKVQLFQDCDKALLRDLVLKLQPVLYLPGDFVCKKGEVGKEMYIVQAGQVLVMGGERGDVVLATLGEGSVFGEISLLALAGGNRRTANVRSRGFSSLFVLSKADLQATIKDYPEAQEILQKKAKRLIKQNQAREKMELTPDENIIIKSRETTPKLLHTVLQMVRPDSFTASIIRRSSRTISRSTIDIPSLETVSPSSAWPWTPSSVSLEVPTRTSRRSSLEVPCSSGRPRVGNIPKTSMSESLPEEEEEEEFLVVETTDVESCDNHLPGSPSSCHSHHSISLHRGSQSPTSQSVFSAHSSGHSSPTMTQPSPSQVTPHQADRRTDTIIKKPPSHCNDDCSSPSKLEKSISRNEIDLEVMSVVLSQAPSSSLQRYSPATLARQSCTSIPDSLFPQSSVQESISCHPASQAIVTQDSEPLTTEQQQNSPPKQDDHQRSHKMSGGRPLSGKYIGKSNDKCKDQDTAGNQQFDKVINHPSNPCLDENKKSAASDKMNFATNTALILKNGSIEGEKSCKTVPEIQENRKNGVLRTQSSRGSRSSKKSGGIKSRKSDSAKCSKNSQGSSCRSKGASYKDKPLISSHTYILEASAKDTNGDSVIEVQGSGSSCKRNNSAREQRQATINHFSATHVSESVKCSLQKDSVTSSHATSVTFQDSLPHSNSKYSVAPSSKKHNSNSLNSSRDSNISHDSSNISNYNFTTNTNSDEDFLKKYGLNSSVESGIIPDTTMSCLDTNNMEESYDLLLSELSKTSSSTTQVLPATSSASTGSSLRHQLSPPPSTTMPSPPPVSTPYKISCSAIVHRECSSSPDSSPFDAQESKL
ncbi:uncharacterized protein LOC121871863 isoform X2 [Homarus americanus]|uniref:uncharacterized protein LOC121871863 isoform X2 n=1 Tax=Homarus americanus TaxID=6706 RepID=UPI001C45E36F|nr:uncharacterized protein LOC121871863 isoform X2 [Homarus americanus]